MFLCLSGGIPRARIMNISLHKTIQALNNPKLIYRMKKRFLIPCLAMASCLMANAADKTPSSLHGYPIDPEYGCLFKPYFQVGKSWETLWKS